MSTQSAISKHGMAWHGATAQPVAALTVLSGLRKLPLLPTPQAACLHCSMMTGEAAEQRAARWRHCAALEMVGAVQSLVKATHRHAPVRSKHHPHQWQQRQETHL